MVMSSWVRDFAYYRIETIALKTWTDPQQKSWLAADLKLREAITISRPRLVGALRGRTPASAMHVSIHYNGWGPYPNPNNYTQDIDSPAVRRGVCAGQRDQGRGARGDCPSVGMHRCDPGVRFGLSVHLSSTSTQVEPVYRLWGQGGFQGKDPRGVAFRHGAGGGGGAAALRDLVTKAWMASEDSSPPAIRCLSVRAVERGAPVPFPFSPLRRRP